MSHPLVLALVGAYVILALATLAFQLRRREGFGKPWMRVVRYIVWTLLWWLYWPVQHGLTDTMLMLRDAALGRTRRRGQDSTGRS